MVVVVVVGRRWRGAVIAIQQKSAIFPSFAFDGPRTKQFFSGRVSSDIFWYALHAIYGKRTVLNRTMDYVDIFNFFSDSQVRAKYAHGQGESVDKVNVGRDAAAAAIAFAAGVGAGAAAYEQTVFDATSAGAMIDALTHGTSGNSNGGSGNGSNGSVTNGSFSSVAASTADEYPCFFDAHDAHFNSFAPPAVFANGAAAAAAAAGTCGAGSDAVYSWGHMSCSIIQQSFIFEPSNKRTALTEPLTEHEKWFFTVLEEHCEEYRLTACFHSLALDRIMTHPCLPPRPAPQTCARPCKPCPL